MSRIGELPHRGAVRRRSGQAPDAEEKNSMKKFSKLCALCVLRGEYSPLQKTYKNQKHYPPCINR
jgi:hypothetical protein